MSLLQAPSPVYIHNKLFLPQIPYLALLPVLRWRHRGRLIFALLLNHSYIDLHAWFAFHHTNTEVSLIFKIKFNYLNRGVLTSVYLALF